MANLYSDNKTKPQLGDSVGGKGPLGHPVAGIVVAIDAANAKVRVAPQVLTDFWCNTSDMTPVPGQPKT